jgi:hypothetical protein
LGFVQNLDDLSSNIQKVASEKSQEDGQVNWSVSQPL